MLHFPLSPRLGTPSSEKTYLIQESGTKALEEEIDRLKLLLKDANAVEGGSLNEFQNRE